MFQLPRESRIHRLLQPSNEWSWNELLANKANYLLEVLIWQNANQGAKKAKQTKKPEPFTPHFLEQPKRKSAINKDAERHNTTAIKDILAMPRR